MQLYMKQKVFSWKDRFTVMDRTGADKYFVEGKLISLGKKLTVTDRNGNEAAFIKQELISLLPKYSVEIGGNTVAVIKKKLSLLKPKYLIEGPDWEVEGKITAHDYVIRQGEIEIAEVHKQWMSWGDTYEINIFNDSNEVPVLAVVLAIDATMDSQAVAASAASN